MFLPALFALIQPLLFAFVLVSGVYLGLRAVRALERKGEPAPEVNALRQRVELLEQQLDSQGEDLRRLAEGQEFTDRLLGERVTRTPPQ